MDAAAELGENPVSKHNYRFSLSMEMSRLTREGTAEPSRETKLSGANADREIFIFPVQLTTSRIGNLTRLIHTLAICVTIHTTRLSATVLPVSRVPPPSRRAPNWSSEEART